MHDVTYLLDADRTSLTVNLATRTYSVWPAMSVGSSSQEKFWRYVYNKQSGHDDVFSSDSSIIELEIYFLLTVVIPCRLGTSVSIQRVPLVASVT